MRIAFVRPSMSGRTTADALQPLIFSVIAALTAPWIILLPDWIARRGWREGRTGEPGETRLFAAALVWAVGGVVVLSLSATKRDVYLYPLLPACALCLSALAEGASRAVKIGDIVTVALDHVRVLKVQGFAERRGSADDAAALFEDLKPVVAASRSESVVATTFTREPGSGRPTKRDRRALERLKS